VCVYTVCVCVHSVCVCTQCVCVRRSVCVPVCVVRRNSPPLPPPHNGRCGPLHGVTPHIGHWGGNMPVVVYMLNSYSVWVSTHTHAHTNSVYTHAYTVHTHTHTVRIESVHTLRVYTHTHTEYTHTHTL